MNKTYGPAEVEALTGWTAEGQRDLRRKGYLEYYGQQGENGRWRYSKRDLVAFFVADVLYSRTLDLRKAFDEGYSMSERVLARIEAKPTSRFRVDGYHSDRSCGSGMRGWEAQFCNSLAEVEGKGYVSMIVEDIFALADAAGKTMGNALQEAD